MKTLRLGLLKATFLLCCFMAGITSSWAQTYAWVLVTDYSNLSTSDTYVIASNVDGRSDYYLLKNNPVTSDSYLPTSSSTAISIVGNKITSTITENDTWVLETTSTTGQYYIKSTKGTNNYLQYNTGTYCKITTLRSANDYKYNMWEIHKTDTYTLNEPHYTTTGLYNIGAKRMLAAFSKNDWRCYASANYNSILNCEVVLYKRVVVPASESVSVSSAGIATYASDFELDYTGVEGLEAYIAKAGTDGIDLQRVYKVPGGTGVLLRATDGGGKNYTVPTTTATLDDMTGNLFKRGAGKGVASVDGSYYNYILNIVNGVLGFYRANGKTVAANRAYLQTTTDAAAISLDFDDATSIANTNLSNLTNEATAPVYNLNGQRVKEPSKGLYIVNGKKVIIK